MSCPHCEHMDAPAEPVVIEEAPDVEPVAEAVVEVARIEANRDVTIAKLEHSTIDEEVAVQLAALQAENEALKAQLAPPEPEPEAVVVQADPDPEPEGVPAPEPEESPALPQQKSKKNPWWG